MDVIIGLPGSFLLSVGFKVGDSLSIEWVVGTAVFGPVHVANPQP